MPLFAISAAASVAMAVLATAPVSLAIEAIDRPLAASLRCSDIGSSAVADERDTDEVVVVNDDDVAVLCVAFVFAVVCCSATAPSVAAAAMAVACTGCCTHTASTASTAASSANPPPAGRQRGRCGLLATHIDMSHNLLRLMCCVVFGVCVCVFVVVVPPRCGEAVWAVFTLLRTGCGGSIRALCGALDAVCVLGYVLC